MTSEARFFLLVVLALSLLLGVCGFAWFKGKPAERYGAALYFVGFIAATAAELVLGDERSVVPMLMLDALAALGFLILAFRYNSLWLGAVMILQGVALGLHATHLTDLQDAVVGGVNLYNLLINVVSLAMLVTFAVSTAMTVRERKRKIAETAPAATPVLT